ncbi:CerR family C-terminal domain-containing protein [Massilia sp. TS11]|uniref:CerR family C-terminal domain-containing protein n=1 Tax=Massilia sp. TS11 TaxID=2908003 RepID=UPI001EDABA16|nr:CerR family C-terminal domain-containing protein [Massilia sp. TS11]MCG2583676.1 CerR family C-terminal domain-containing protein [Massilia sp. TS11]
MNTSPPSHDARRARADGEKSRERLLQAAVRLFAEQGFARTSTREIALAAGTNVAAIAYYFGDKAGLYRAAFRSCCPAPELQVPAGLAQMPLADALRALYRGMLAPLTEDSAARLCVRLVFREMLEPTGLWLEEIDTSVRPAHAALAQLIARELGLDAPDDGVARLAFCLDSLVVYPLMAQDVVEALRPSLIADAAAIEAWAARAAEYGLALIAAERSLRAAAPRSSRKRQRPA